MKLKITLLSLALAMQFTAQNLQWARGFGGSFDEESTSIAVDAAGNVYTAGYFWNTVDFDPGPGTFTLTSVGNSDIYVQKLDASGNFVWAAAMGSVTDDNANDIAVDAAGDVYITGVFNTLCDFDPGPNSVQLITPGGSFDAFVEKLSSSGNYVWVKQMGGSSDDEGKALFLDGSGNIYTTGEFKGTADFNPGSGTANLVSAGGSDIFVQKLTNNGTFVWAASFGGATTDSGNDITVDASGNVITTGFFQALCDFDPGVTSANLTSSGLKDVFISKLNSSGAYVWAKQIGGAADDIGNAIANDAAGNVYLTGGFSGLIDMDPGTGVVNATSNGLDDIFTLMLAGTGSYGWSALAGGTTSDKGKDIYVNNSEVYTTGEFSGTVDFDPGAGTANLNSSAGGVYVQKLSTSGAYTWAFNYSGSNVFGCTLDAAGNVYTTGIFGGTSDMDPGSGSVTLTANGNTDIYVHKMDQLPVGIEGFLAEEEIALYPNPVSSTLNISCKSKNSESEIIIYDLCSKEILRKTILATEGTIDVTNLADGIYLLQLIKGDIVTQKKVVVSK